jgi:glycosyltransferase involved in cell wall biosynthesis
MPTAAIVSYRLFGRDGVSIESEKWRWALRELGFSVSTVAGEGPVDHHIAGLAIDADEPPDTAALAAALAGVDLVVAENICSLPLNPAASAAVVAACRGRACVLHHHDLPWQREHLAQYGVPDDPGWRHVTGNDRSRIELAERGIVATTIRNAFDMHPALGERALTRAGLGVAPDERLVLQPTRAIPRKNVAGGIALAEALGATYWLLGPAEDGFGPELALLLAAARCRVLHGPGATTAGERVADAYAACDVVVLPSSEEGFGNPAIESAIFGRPLCIGPYPVADELARFGFDWFALDESARLAAWLADPDDLIERNRAVAERHFSLDALPQLIGAVVGDLDPRLVPPASALGK